MISERIHKSADLSTNLLDVIQTESQYEPEKFPWGDWNVDMIKVCLIPRVQNATRVIRLVP